MGYNRILSWHFITGSRNYNLDTGFQPINVYHAADGNTYKDTGEYDSLGRRYFRGISTSGATIFTGRVIGPDGTDNWVDIGSDGNSPFSRLQNISTGQVVHSTHTEGDAIFVDNPMIIWYLILILILFNQR